MKLLFSFLMSSNTYSGWADFFGFFTGTQAEWLAYKNLNSGFGASSSIMIPTFAQFMSGLEDDRDWGGTFVLTVISLLRNWSLSKWEYKFGNEKNKFNWEVLEGYLFFRGRAMVFKNPEGKYICSQFVVIKWDHDFFPIKVQPVLKNKDKKINKVYTVGKNCVLLYNSYPWLFGKQFYGPLMSAWSLIQDLARIYYHINNNITLNRAMYYVPLKMSYEEGLHLQNILNSDSNVVPLSDNIFTRSNEDTREKEDRTETLWKNFDNVYTFIKAKFGIQGNPNEKKERMIYKEITVNEQIAVAQIEAEMKTRKQFEKDFKEVFRDTITITKRQDLVDNSIDKGEESSVQKFKGKER